MEIYGGLPRAVPEDVGISTSRLERIAPVMQGYVDNGKIPCALTMIARRGKLVHFEKFGMQDIAAAKPIQFDTIFRLLLDDKADYQHRGHDALRRRAFSTHHAGLRICSIFQGHEGLHGRWQCYC